MSIEEIAGGDRSLHAGHVSATWVLVEHVDGVGVAGKKRKRRTMEKRLATKGYIHITVLKGRRSRTT